MVPEEASNRTTNPLKMKHLLTFDFQNIHRILRKSLMLLNFCSSLMLDVSGRFSQRLLDVILAEKEVHHTGGLFGREQVRRC